MKKHEQDLTQQEGGFIFGIFHRLRQPVLPFWIT